MLSNQDQSSAESGPSSGLWRAPVWESPARLGWQVRYSDVVFTEPPYAVVQVTPVFPGCHPDLFERGIVWDPFALLEAARRPGGHQVLTADCGYAPDVYIEELVQVSHPDVDTIVWELDLQGLRPALDVAVTGGAQDGFVRLVFARDAFEADLRALLGEVQTRARAPVPLDELAQAYDWDAMGWGQAARAHLAVGEFEPDLKGRALEGLLALDVGAAWPREPVWPPGTVVAFGYFEGVTGHTLLRVNGLPPEPAWPGWFFPRWEAMNAFRRWVNWTVREFSGPASLQPIGRDAHRANLRFLRHEADSKACHDAGRRLAQVLQATLHEGCTAPGVTVRYVECPLAAGGLPEARP